MDPKSLDFRPLRLSDAPVLLQFYSDADAMRFRGSAPLQHLEDARQMVAQAEEQARRGLSYRLAILQGPAKTMIGTFLYKVLKAQACEIGYSLGPPYWGQGLATLAVSEMIHRLHRQGYRHFEAWTHIENTGSIRVLEKAGFQRQPKSEKLNQYCYLLVL